MICRLSTVTVLTLGLAVASATALLAAIPNQSPEQLQKNADLIAVGTVQEIDAEKTTDELWERQTGTVLFLVEKTEKGEKVAPGDQMKIGFWTQRWVGPKGVPVPTYGNGHDLPKPDPKAKVRVFVKIKEDGSYEALLPNGFAAIATAKPTK